MIWFLSFVEYCFPLGMIDIDDRGLGVVSGDRQDTFPAEKVEAPRSEI